LWPGLSDAGLANPVAAYAVVLGAIAATAGRMGALIGVGGLLPLLSDSLIGVRLAKAAILPGPPIWVMLTYLLGQFLVTMGWVRAGLDTGAAAPVAAAAGG
jgi:Protein of unknown function (DUF1653)/YhhN family